MIELAAFHEARARGAAFPVVITDLGKPYVDGRKVCNAIKTAAPGTVVRRLASGHRHFTISAGRGELRTTTQQMRRARIKIAQQTPGW